LPPGNTGNSDYYISHAQSIGALNNVDQYSGFSNGGYADYTSSIAPLEVYPGQDVGFNIEVQNQGVATNSQVEIWVDYNGNGDFSDPGENIISSNTSPTNPFVGTYHVPGNANLGTYHLRVRSKANGTPIPCGNDDYGETEDYLVKIVPEPNCPPPSNVGSSDYYISHAQSIGALNDVDQYSGFSNGGYADYTGSIAPLEVYPGQDVGFNIEVQNQGVATNSQVEIWVDYNGNGDFSDPGENIISSNTSPTNPFVGTYHVPGNANLGTYHLRVRSKANGTPLPCGNDDYGETEDYLVKVVAPSPSSSFLQFGKDLDASPFNDFTYYPNPVKNRLSLQS